MITFAPSPTWYSLLRLLFCKQPNDFELSQTWRKQGDQAIWFSRTAWALHTIVRWWEMSISEKPTIWVPGYFCNQSLWPLRQTGAKIVFYPIQEHMLPNWEACKKLADEAKPDIFIVTHFYGFLVPTREIRDFCNEHNALLIEDAAHIMSPSGDVGERGDFILYSPYKLFPLAHGAVCIIRPRLEKFLEKRQVKKKITIKEVSLMVGAQAPDVKKWIVKKIIQKLIGNTFDFLRKKLAFEEVGTSHPMPYTPQMHPLMKKLLYGFLDRIPKYISHRKECAILWENLFYQNNIALTRLTFNKEETPYIGVFKSNDNEAEKIYNTFNKWPLSSWPDLPPEVRANPELHKTTLSFRESMIVVPVHQTLKFSELRQRYGQKQETVKKIK